MTCHLDTSNEVSSQFAFLWLKRRILKFWNDFSNFFLSTIHSDATKLRVNWPFGSRDKVQNRISTWRLLQPSRTVD